MLIFWYWISRPAAVSILEFEPGVVALAEAQFGQKLYAVHRLDKGTSGLLLLAKSSEAAAKLSVLFQNQHIEKFYLARRFKNRRKNKAGLKATWCRRAARPGS